MKKVLLAVFTVLTIMSVNAQEKGKIRVGLDLGYVFATGGGGLLVNLEPKYNIADNMSVGIRFSSAAVGRNLTSPDITDSDALDIDLAFNSSYLATFDYYFNKGNSSTAPYIGAGLGSYSFGKIKGIEPGLNELPDAESKFGGMIRGGVEFGKFKLGIEYNIVPSTDYGDDITSTNSYFGASVGFYVGGGKWGK